MTSLYNTNHSLSTVILIGHDGFRSLDGDRPGGDPCEGDASELSKVAQR